MGAADSPETDCERACHLRDPWNAPGSGETPAYRPAATLQLLHPKHHRRLVHLLTAYTPLPEVLLASAETHSFDVVSESAPKLDISHTSKGEIAHMAAAHWPADLTASPAAEIPEGGLQTWRAAGLPARVRTHPLRPSSDPLQSQDLLCPLRYNPNTEVPSMETFHKKGLTHSIIACESSIPRMKKAAASCGLCCASSTKAFLAAAARSFSL